MSTGTTSRAAVEPQIYTEAEQYRAMLSLAVEKSDAAFAQKALDLSIAATERARLRWQESNEVSVDEDGRMHAKNIAGLMKIGGFYSASTMVPERFRGNASDCAIGAQMADRLKCDVVMLLQNLYIVYGTPGVTGKFVIALLNTSSAIRGRVTFELSGEGKSRTCTASAVDAETGITHSQTVDIAMAEREGWTKQKKEQVSKWLTMPDVMLQYRSAAFLGRIDFPEIILGMTTLEELEDIHKINLEGESVAPLTSSSQEQVIESLAVPPAKSQQNTNGTPRQPETPTKVAEPSEAKREPVATESSTVESTADGSTYAESEKAKHFIGQIWKSSQAENIDRLVRKFDSPAENDCPADERDIQAVSEAAAKRKASLVSSGGN